MENNYSSLVLYTGSLPGTDTLTLKENLLGVQEALFTEMGIISPLIQVEQDDELAAGTFRLKMNGTMQELMVGLDVGEYWVFASKDEFQQSMDKTAMEFRLRESVEPNSGAPGVIIKPSAILVENLQNAGKDLKTMFQEAGVEIRDQSGYIIFCVAASLRRNLPELVTDGTTRYMLMKLESLTPALGKAVSQEIPFEEIKQGLKRNLAMHQSIRALPLTLEKMLIERVQEKTL